MNCMRRWKQKGNAYVSFLGNFLNRNNERLALLIATNEQLELDLGAALHSLLRANDTVERLKAEAAEAAAALAEARLARRQLELMLDAACVEIRECVA